jgi:hypothetical protein
LAPTDGAVRVFVNGNDVQAKSGQAADQDAGPRTHIHYFAVWRAVGAEQVDGRFKPRGRGQGLEWWKILQEAVMDRQELLGKTIVFLIVHRVPPYDRIR